ncbi:MAG: hypothetical protein FWC68_00470 [Oscillospiraceae bacterium]|nr:hypothetical protein [Oscillospiraceae bacterium]
MKDIRNIQLRILGFIALLITPVVVIVSCVIYNFPFPSNISLTATMPNTVSPILPFCLGMLAIFSISYGLIHNYNLAERLLLFIMGIGFTLVAIQPCYSQYITTEYVGVLHLTPSMSHLVHNIGALMGFSSMIVWVLFFFTKSDKPKYKQTREKRMRNFIYVISSLISTAFLLFSLFKYHTSSVLITEFIILTFCGIAILIKGGLFLEDMKSFTFDKKLVKT